MTFYILFMIHFAKADEMSDLREKLLLQATNQTTMSQSMERYKKMLSLQAQCEFELENKDLPGSCYAFVHFKQGFGIITSETEAEQKSRLDRICIQSAERGAKAPEHDEFLGKECQSLVKAKIKKQNYVLEESKPEELILGTQ